MPQPDRSYRYSMPAPEDYFRGISPMCRRILDDMTTVQDSYGEQWKDLSYEDQCKVLDQRIVDEATFRRYEVGGLEGPDYEYFPKLKIPTGQKIVSDEKLSARGYACSWRDEHSAPFSWHTRSQMELNLDTPPPTPTQNLTTAAIVSPEEEHKLKLAKQQSILSTIYKPEKTFKATPFLWHYDPTPDLKPPDPPDLVLASSLTREDFNRSSMTSNESSSYNHLVIRTDEERLTGIGGWFRGALSIITGTCLPIHTYKTRRGKDELHQGSPFMHPELRPPHVIAKAAKVSLDTINKPPKKQLKESSESLYRIAKDSTLNSECPSLETTTTFDVTSDRDSNDEISRSGTNQNLSNRSHLSNNRNSLLYGTFTEEESLDELQVTVKSPLMGQLQAELSSHIEKRSQDLIDNCVLNDTVDYENNKPATSIPSMANSIDNLEATEDMPLINHSANDDEFIPKTGFDFLDDW